MPGCFLCLDGVDGAGKSTQMDRLSASLRARGLSVVVCRDPGGEGIGDAIRQLLLDVRSQMCMRCEMLLYMASRAQLVHDVIAPALAEGKVVLCDRFLLSTLAYQGYAGGLDIAEIWQVGMIATAGVLPDWTGVLDLDCERARERRQGPVDRIEQRESAFHRKVREGFLAEARRTPGKVTIIDASASPDEVTSVIEKEVVRVLAAVDRS